MTKSEPGQPSTTPASSREITLIYPERAPPTAPSIPTQRHLPILPGATKIVGLLTVVIVVVVFVVSRSGTSNIERQADSERPRSEPDVQLKIEDGEVSRDLAFVAFRSADGLQGKVDALLPIAEAGDPEAMLEVSLAYEQMGRLSDSAEWDRRLTEAGDINGVGRYAMKVAQGLVPGVDPRSRVKTLTSNWERQVELIDGEFVYAKLDPRVALGAGHLYSAGIDNILGADQRRASGFFHAAVRTGLKSAERDWALHCAEHQTPYSVLACDKFVPTLLALSDDGSGEALYRQAEAYEEGWAGEANMTVAKLRYREARAVGHVGAATRLIDLNEPIIRDDAGWTKILQKAVAGDVTAKRYIGLGCGQDTEIAGPDHDCVLRMLSPVTDKTDPETLLEVCLAYEATGQSAKAVLCEYQLAAGGSADGKLLYATRLITGEGAVPDPVRGLELIATSSFYGLDPRTMFRIGDFYERAPTQLKEWGSNALHAAYWYREGKDHIRNGWVSWVRACEHHHGGDSPGSGWCEGYEELRYEYKSNIRSNAISSAYGSADRIVVSVNYGHLPGSDFEQSGDHKNSGPSIKSSTLPSVGKVTRVSDEEMAILRRKWGIAESKQTGRATAESPAGRVVIGTPEEIQEIRRELEAGRRVYINRPED
ncbi:MAG TPA: hypothetical protein PKY73_08790 [Hyphomonas sp.]|nr:hypothetical protein [Hyphomonas sp.]